MEFAVRAESPDDASAIAVVTEAAFRNIAYSSHTEQFIVSALRKSGKLAVSLVAEVDREVVGHVAVSAVSISDGSAGWFGVGPVSVIPRLQGCRIGSRLMERAVQVLREQGAAGCVLLGDPKFYQRFGFRAEPGIRLADVPPHHFLAMSFGATLPRGTVSYHESFYVRSK